MTSIHTQIFNDTKEMLQQAITAASSKTHCIETWIKLNRKASAIKEELYESGRLQEKNDENHLLILDLTKATSDLTKSVKESCWLNSFKELAKAGKMDMPTFTHMERAFSGALLLLDQPSGNEFSVLYQLLEFISRSYVAVDEVIEMSKERSAA